jgi:hypothetical protein
VQRRLDEAERTDVAGASRTSRGASPARSITVVTWPLHGPESITRSTACSRWRRISPASFSATPCAGRMSVEDRIGSPSTSSSAIGTWCPGMRTPMVSRGVSSRRGTSRVARRMKV